jgi:hypothetical protein
VAEPPTLDDDVQNVGTQFVGLVIGGVAGDVHTRYWVASGVWLGGQLLIGEFRRRRFRPPVPRRDVTVTPETARVIVYAPRPVNLAGQSISHSHMTGDLTVNHASGTGQMKFTGSATATVRPGDHFII